MKKGFTLIELLAVIVILAIIALIATPIVLNIINDTRESATLRSAEMYLDALELSIAQATLKNKNISDGVYNITEGGNVCLEYNTDSVCTNKLEVETSGEVPKEGTITIANGTITGLNIILNEKEIMKNSKNEMVYVKFLDEVCEYISGTPKTAGAKYTCKVDPNKDAYAFYVLNTRNAVGEIITESSTDKEAVSINLIMDQNINSDGTPAGITGVSITENLTKYNLVDWVNEDDYGTLAPYDENICWRYPGCALNDKGPITAMNFLQEATKNWTNTNEMTIDTYYHTDGVSFKMKTYNAYARMPIYLSDASKTEVSNKTDSNAYLYENLEPNMHNVDGIYSYWTLSAPSSDLRGAQYVFSNGYVTGDYVDFEGVRGGVRPVITLKL